VRNRVRGAEAPAKQHGGEKVGRKKRCPKCGSKKVDEYSTPMRCKVCGFTWTGTGKSKIPKKDKVRF